MFYLQTYTMHFITVIKNTIYFTLTLYIFAHKRNLSWY